MASLVTVSAYLVGVANADRLTARTQTSTCNEES